MCYMDLNKVRVFSCLDQFFILGKIGWKNKGKYTGKFSKISGKFPRKLPSGISFRTLVGPRLQQVERSDQNTCKNTVFIGRIAAQLFCFDIVNKFTRKQLPLLLLFS